MSNSLPNSRSSMILLFSSISNYLDVGSGAAISTRETLLALVRRGHAVRVFCGAIFDDPELDVGELFHVLTSRGVTPEIKGMEGVVEGERIAFNLVRFNDSGIEATVFVPLEVERSPRGSLSEKVENLFARILYNELKSFRPDVFASYGGAKSLRLAARGAKRLGARTVFMLHNLSYTRRESFRYFDEIVVPSDFAGRRYRERLGLETKTLAPLIDPEKTLVRENTRRFVTYVNPSVEKGLYFFIGLALLFNARRPDVLFQIVEGRGQLEKLATIPEARRLTNLYALRRVAAASDFLKETRLLLFPSLCEETFGRVAVEAGLNGVPVLCGDRGNLPELVGDSELVLPLPNRFTPYSRRLPTEEELAPWFSVITRLWDDDGYASQIGTKLKDRFQRYSYPVVAAETETFFREFAILNDYPH